MLGCACWPVASLRGGGGTRRTHTAGGGREWSCNRKQTDNQHEARAYRPGSPGAAPQNGPASQSPTAETRPAPPTPAQHLENIQFQGLLTPPGSVAPLSQSSGQFTQSKQTAAGSRPHRPLACWRLELCPCKFWVVSFQQEHGARGAATRLRDEHEVTRRARAERHGITFCG